MLFEVLIHFYVIFDSSQALDLIKKFQSQSNKNEDLGGNTVFYFSDLLDNPKVDTKQLNFDLQILNLYRHTIFKEGVVNANLQSINFLIRLLLLVKNLRIKHKKHLKNAVLIEFLQNLIRVLHFDIKVLVNSSANKSALDKLETKGKLFY